MFRAYIHVLLILLISCQSTRQTSYYINGNDEFEIENDHFTGEKYIDTLYYDNGSIRAIGSFAVNSSNEKTKFPIGRFTEYYENGTVKSSGNFQLTSFVNCCFAGWCRMFYPYKTDEWRYYYETGQLKSIGTYSNKITHLDTSCQGGAEVLTNAINNNWKFFSKESLPTEPEEKLKKELEKIEYYYEFRGM